MTEGNFDLIPLLDYINPSVLSYQEWINVGMALKHEGYTAMDWDRVEVYYGIRDPSAKSGKKLGC